MPPSSEDEQVPGTDYVMYADIVGETLLKELRSKVQEETNFGRVIENYSFVRIYKKKKREINQKL